MKAYEAKRKKKNTCLASVKNSANLNFITIHYLDEVDTLDDVDIDDDVDTELEVDTLKGKESYYLKNFKLLQIVFKMQGI